MPCSPEIAVCLRKRGVEDHPRFPEASQQRLHLPLVVSRDGAALNCRVEFRFFARVGKDGCEVAFGWESQIAAARDQDHAVFLHGPRSGGDSLNGLVNILVERITGVGRQHHRVPVVHSDRGLRLRCGPACVIGLGDVPCVKAGGPFSRVWRYVNKSAPAITERAVSARGLPPLGARIADRNACFAWSRGAERAPCVPWKHPVSESFQHRVHPFHHALKPSAVGGRVSRAHHQHQAASRRTRQLSDRLRVRLT